MIYNDIYMYFTKLIVKVGEQPTMGKYHQTGWLLVNRLILNTNNSGEMPSLWGEYLKLYTSRTLVLWSS